MVEEDEVVDGGNGGLMELNSPGPEIGLGGLSDLDGMDGHAM